MGIDHRHVGFAGDKPTMFNHTEWQRKRRRENPERDREYSRQYYWRHKDDPSWRERRRASERRWYCLHKEKRNANAHDWHQRLKAAAIEHYGKACACCGESTYEFLCIDHINGGGNRQREQLGCSRNFFSWLRKNGYPEGFRTLCHNCNQAIGYNGYCPHQLIPADDKPVLPLPIAKTIREQWSGNAPAFFFIDSGMKKGAAPTRLPRSVPSPRYLVKTCYCIVANA